MIRHGEISDLPETKHLIVLRIPTVLSISKDCYIEDIPQTNKRKLVRSLIFICKLLTLLWKCQLSENDTIISKDKKDQTKTNSLKCLAASRYWPILG